MAGDLSTGIIILAAGSSERMGQSKQLLKIGDETLLRRAVRTALGSDATTVLVVLGARESEHRMDISDMAVECVLNSEWQRGMGTSLRAGLQWVLTQAPQISSILLMVCDQPRVTSAHLNKLIEAFQQGHAVSASAYEETLGVPAIFSSSCFASLMKIEDQAGARKVIEQYKAECYAVPFPEGALDVDTPEDFQKITSSSNP